MCAEAWAQRASRSPCSLRPGSPWHMSGVQGGRNSGSQHDRSNHEHERSSLSSAVAKEVAKGVVHVGQRQEHVKRAREPECRHEHRCSQREPWCASRRRVQGAAAEARMVCNTWQLEGSDLLGKTCKHGRASRERWARRCRSEVLSAHLRKAWICRAMRLAGLLASTAPQPRPDRQTPRLLEGQSR